MDHQARIVGPDPGRSRGDRSEVGSVTQPGAVVVASGHMVDAAERPQPRFPPDKEGAVRERIAATLDAWGIGPGDLAICGGARGADILFAELCLERGAHVRLYLPLPREEFVERSVRLEESDWERRFRALLGRCEVLDPVPPSDPAAARSTPFARSNGRMLDAALAEGAPGRTYAVLVWDGKAGDGSGGTAEVAVAVERLGWRTAVIDPAAA